MANNLVFLKRAHDDLKRRSMGQKAPPAEKYTAIAKLIEPPSRPRPTGLAVLLLKFVQRAEELVNLHTLNLAHSHHGV